MAWMWNLSPRHTCQEVQMGTIRLHLILLQTEKKDQNGVQCESWNFQGHSTSVMNVSSQTETGTGNWRQDKCSKTSWSQFWFRVFTLQLDSCINSDLPQCLINPVTVGRDAASIGYTLHPWPSAAYSPYSSFSNLWCPRAVCKLALPAT